MADALHAVDTLTQSRIAQGDRAVIVVQQPVDLFALGKTADGTVLPEDWSDIRRSAQKCLVPDAQCLMAQIRPLFHELPELFFIAFRAAGYIHQIDGHGALVNKRILLSAWTISSPHIKRRPALCTVTHSVLPYSLWL